MYLIGGLNHSGSATNDIWAYSPAEEKWEKLAPEGVTLPPLESFGSRVVTSGEEERIIIAMGFNEETSSPSNVIYQYVPASNKLTILFEGAPASKGRNCNTQTCLLQGQGAQWLLIMRLSTYLGVKMRRSGSKIFGSSASLTTSLPLYRERDKYLW